MNNLVVVRGGGDVASGTIMKLVQCGWKVLVLETDRPSSIRRNVSFSEAVYQGRQTVEGVTCHLAGSMEEAVRFLEAGRLTLLVDPAGECLKELKPIALVDGILAKKNLGTNRTMAPITIGLGPGFRAGEDVDAVIETMRGHRLGRVIYQGEAQADTGIPGMIAGYAKERVIYSPAKGRIKHVRKITDTVKKGELIAYIQPEGAETAEAVPVYAAIDGILRGLIREHYPVREGFKIADIDPRMDEYENCFTISDKARCIAGGVVEAIMHLSGR